MGKATLKSYRGALTAEQVAAGMTVARGNSLRLLDDARALLAGQRWPTAAALAILAIEEVGKLGILRQIATARDDESLKRLWKEYRSHRSKNKGWIAPRLMMDGARSLEDLRPAVDQEGDHTAVLDAIKQIAIYSDCLGQAYWSSPETAVDEELARGLVATAEILTSTMSRATTPREIELWVVHIGPVITKPLPIMKAALIQWAHAMRAEGLTDVDVESWEGFVYGPAASNAST